MKIGEFILMVETTKDTVRHYEELYLLIPAWEKGKRIYQQQDIENFNAIKEMQDLGLSLKEVQAIFNMKRANGCGSNELVQCITDKLLEKRKSFIEEEKLVKHRRIQAEEMVDSLNQIKNQPNK